MIIIEVYKLLEKSLLETLLSVFEPLTSFRCKGQSRLFKAQITTFAVYRGCKIVHELLVLKSDLKSDLKS